MLPTKEEFLELYNRKFGKSAKIQDVQLDSLSIQDSSQGTDADFFASFDAHFIIPQFDSNNGYVFDRDFFGFVSTNQDQQTFGIRMYGKPNMQGTHINTIPMFLNEVHNFGRGVAFCFYGYSVTRY